MTDRLEQLQNKTTEKVRVFQITLHHSSTSKSYLYITLEEGETREDLERKVKIAYYKDYQEERKLVKRHFSFMYKVRNTVNVKEWDIDKDRAVRGSLKFSLRCSKVWDGTPSL